MPFDIDNPPIDPPEGCRHRLLWRIARTLHEAHRRDAAGFCIVPECRRDNILHPCRAFTLAIEGLHASCPTTAGTSPPWMAVVRQKIADGQIDATDALIEALWHHQQRRAAQRYAR
jgi:hypothetical protein